MEKQNWPLWRTYFIEMWFLLRSLIITNSNKYYSLYYFSLLKNFYVRQKILPLSEWFSTNFEIGKPNKHTHLFSPTSTNALLEANEQELVIACRIMCWYKLGDKITDLFYFILLKSSTNKTILIFFFLYRFVYFLQISSYQIWFLRSEC